MQVRDGKSTMKAGNGPTLTKKGRFLFKHLIFDELVQKMGLVDHLPVGAEPVCRQQPYEAMIIA